MAERYAYTIAIKDDGTATLKSLTGQTLQYTNAVKQASQAMGILYDSSGGVARSWNALGDTASKTTPKVRSLGSSIEEMAGGIVGSMGLAMAGMVAFQKFTAFTTDSVKEFYAAQMAGAALARAYGDAQAASMEGIATSFKLFDDDEVKAAMSAGRFYEISAAGIKRLTPLLAEFTAYQILSGEKNATLTGTMDLLGKAMQGQETALQRQGVKFSEVEKKVLETGSEMQKLDVIIGRLQPKIEGSSAALENLGVGGAMTAKVAIGNLKEVYGEFGDGLTGVETKYSIAAKGLELITSAAKTALPVWIELSRHVASTIPGLGTIAGIVGHAGRIPGWLSGGDSGGADTGQMFGPFQRNPSNADAIAAWEDQERARIAETKLERESAAMYKAQHAGGGAGGKDLGYQPATYWDNWKVEMRLALEGFEQEYKRVNDELAERKPYESMVNKMYGSNEREQQRQAQETAERWSEAFRPEIDNTAQYMARSFTMATDTLASGLSSAMVGDKVDTQAMGKNLARSFIEMNLRLAMQIPMWLLIKSITAGIAADMTIATAGLNVPSAFGMGVVGAAIGSPFKFHKGGWIGQIPTAHNGMWIDERLTKTQTGERVASRQEVRNAGGKRQLDRVLSGKGGGDSYTVNIYPSANLDEEKIGNIAMKRIQTLQRRNKARLNA